MFVGLLWLAQSASEEFLTYKIHTCMHTVHVCTCMINMLHNNVTGGVMTVLYIVVFHRLFYFLFYVFSDQGVFSAS